MLLSSGTALLIGIAPVAGLLLLALLAGALAVAGFAARPHLAAPLIAGALAFVPALKIFVSPGVGPAKDVIVVLLVLAMVVRAARRSPVPQAHASDAWVVAGVAVLLALYLLNAGGHHDVAWLQATRLVVEAFGLFLFAYTTPNPVRAWRWACASLVAAAL